VDQRIFCPDDFQNVFVELPISNTVIILSFVSSLFFSLDSETAKAVNTINFVIEKGNRPFNIVVKLHYDRLNFHNKELGYIIFVFDFFSFRHFKLREL